MTTTRRAEQMPTEEEITQTANQGEDVKQQNPDQPIPQMTTQVEVQQGSNQSTSSNPNQQQMG